MQTGEYHIHTTHLALAIIITKELSPWAQTFTMMYTPCTPNSVNLGGAQMLIRLMAVCFRVTFFTGHLWRQYNPHICWHNFSFSTGLRWTWHCTLQFPELTNRWWRWRPFRSATHPGNLTPLQSSEPKRTGPLPDYNLSQHPILLVLRAYRRPMVTNRYHFSLTMWSVLDSIKSARALCCVCIPSHVWHYRENHAVTLLQSLYI